MKITKAIIPAGGLGTRFLPATKAIPKELFPVINKPVLQYILEECLDSGITDIFIVINKEKEIIKNYFTPNEALEERLKAAGREDYIAEWKNLLSKLKITFGVQKEVKGSAHAMLPAEEWANGEPVAVLFGDDLNVVGKNKRPVIGQLADQYEKHQKMIIGCKYFETEQIRKYSAVNPTKWIGKGKKVCEINGIIEKPQGEIPSNLAGLARYIMPADMFDVIRRTPVSVRGELELTETMNIIARERGAIAIEFNSLRYDAGDVQGFVQFILDEALRNKSTSKWAKDYVKTLVKTNFSEVKPK